jgi:hypothetical protein
MRNLLLTALLLASTYCNSFGYRSGDWEVAPYTFAREGFEEGKLLGVSLGVNLGPAFNYLTTGLIVTSFYGDGGGNAEIRRLDIPSQIDGWPVVAIAGYNASGEFDAPFSTPNITLPFTHLTIPSGVKVIGTNAFRSYGFLTITSLTIPNSVEAIGDRAFEWSYQLSSLTVPDKFITKLDRIGMPGEASTSGLINALANNDAFVTAVANKIKATGGNYGLATQSGLSSAIETLATKSELSPLATKAELTSSLTQSRTDGVNSVLSNPNLWTLYTTSQIQNMAVGDLVLSRQSGGGFVLNYDIEQSTDLQNWTRYEALSLPLNGLPTDKAFVRIKAKQ